MTPPISIDGTDITGATIDGTDVQEITVDGDVVFTADTTPATVIHQYTASNFTGSSWPDNVGNANMSILGSLSSTTYPNGTPAVSAGVNDGGQASGPHVLGSQQTFGIGFTIQTTDTGDPTAYLGILTGPPGNRDGFGLNDTDFIDGSNGEPNAFCVGGTGDSSIEANQFIADGNPHTIIWNKNSDDGTTWEMYIDDMVNPASLSKQNNGFDRNSLALSSNVFGFYGQGFNGGFNDGKAFAASIFEFNSAPYSQSERVAFKARGGL